MAIQQANDPANQIDYPHRQALTQFMNDAGNFLLEHLGNAYYLGPGRNRVRGAERAFPLLLRARWNLKTDILCAAYALCANPITLLLYFRTSTGHVRSQLLHLQFDVCRQPDLCTE